jgi:hypothetical protein
MSTTRLRTAVPVSTPGAGEPTEGRLRALFREARRRRRRRRMVIALSVIVVIGIAALSATLLGPTHGSHRRPAAPRRTPATAEATGAVVPRNPGSLAIGPDGALFIVDSGRDQILRRLPGGSYRVVAGTGRRGFSGDGGLASHARLRLDASSGVTVGRNGTLYFADTGNGRVREVHPDGIISTIVGGGNRIMGTPRSPVSVRARRAAFGPDTVMGLTIGPGGDLYIGAGPVYRLTATGWLLRFVGAPFDAGPLPSHRDADSNPARPADFDPAVRLAFDGRGDLLVAGGGGWGLYERTAGGRLRYLEDFRGDGFWGSLAAAPDGAVILSDRSGLARFTPVAGILPIGRSPVDDPTSALDVALRGGSADRSHRFVGGDGVAVTPSGDFIVDTDADNGWTDRSAVLEVAPPGDVSTLWRS